VASGQTRARAPFDVGQTVRRELELALAAGFVEKKKRKRGFAASRI
jgi:hypothetical protein